MLDFNFFCKCLTILVCLNSNMLLGFTQFANAPAIASNYSLQQAATGDSVVTEPDEDTLVLNFNDAYPVQKDYYLKRIDKRNFDQQHWKSVTKDINYNEAEQVKKIPNRKLPTFHFPTNLSTAAQAVLVILVIGIIAFVIYKLIDGSVFRANKTIKTSPLFELDEEKALSTYDLSAALTEALQQMEYRLALRIYYLMVLKQLWQKKYINWQLDKTNTDYLKEMATNSHYASFAEVTSLFEYLWYGDQEITELQANLLIPRFKALLQQLKTEKVEV